MMDDYLNSFQKNLFYNLHNINYIILNENYKLN